MTKGSCSPEKIIEKNKHMPTQEISLETHFENLTISRKTTLLRNEISKYGPEYENGTFSGA